MTDADRELLARLDADRRKREDDLLLLLLLLIDDASQQPGAASAITTALLTRGVPQIATSMAQAHMGAFAIHASPAATSHALNHSGALIRTYTPAATATASAMADSIEEAIRLYDATPGRQTQSPGVVDDVRHGTPDVHAALSGAGYTAGKPTAIKLGIEKNIVTASNAGLVMGAAAMDTVYAFRHVSVLDNRTSDICAERANLVLPIEDEYWQQGFPSLHWHCRSVLLAIIDPNFIASTTYPELAPDPGFGSAPPGLLDALIALKNSAA